MITMTKESMARRDIEIRNKMILRLYLSGASRKQIAAKLDWIPTMEYEAVKKVIQKMMTARRFDRRRTPRD